MVRGLGACVLIGCKLSFSTFGVLFMVVDSESFNFYFLGFWVSECKGTRRLAKGFKQGFEGCTRFRVQGLGFEGCAESVDGHQCLPKVCQ